MIKHIKRLLGIGQKPVAPTAPAPYKIETAVSEPVAPAPKPAKKATANKPKSPRKPRTPKA